MTNIPVKNIFPVYYPSMVCDLTLRFDSDLLAGKPEPAPTTVSDLINKGTGKVQQIFDKPGYSVDPDTKSPEKTTFVPLRVPKTARVELNGYRQASTFTITMDYRYLPIDPRLLRAAAIDIHLGTVSELDFGRGMSAAAEDNVKRPVLLSTKDADGKTRNETLLLRGVIDSWTVTHNTNSSEITMEGRDLRALLMQSYIVPAMLKRLDLTMPINDVVAQIIGLYPFGDRIAIGINPDEWTDFGGIPSPCGVDLNTRVTFPAVTPSTPTGVNTPGTIPTLQPNGDQTRLTFWDVITKYCFLVGAIPHFIGKVLWLRPSRHLFSQLRQGNQQNPNLDTPFLNGRTRVIDGSNLAVRKMIYGHNVDQLRFTRKYMGYKPSIIRCVSVDTSSNRKGRDRLIEGTWPTITPIQQKFATFSSKNTKPASTNISASGNAVATEILTVPVPGQTDPKRLQEIARDIFEEIAHQEMGGSCTTKSLGSFGGSNADPDMLKLRPGDAVEFAISARPLNGKPGLAAEAIDMQTALNDQNIQHITNLVQDKDLATAIAISSNPKKVNPMMSFFRVQDVKFNWNATTGIEIEFDFQNYVVSRFEVDPVQKPQSKFKLSSTALSSDANE
jgi:hypothetical protein